MGWNDFTYAMGNLSNVFRFSKGILDKSSGESLGTRMQNAGIELFGNSMALDNARNIRSHTGSNIGYMGFYSANGDASQAMQNTTNASLWAASMYTPMFYNNMGGMGGYGMYGSYPTTTYSSYSYTTGGNNGFNNKFFRGYWA